MPAGCRRSRVALTWPLVALLGLLALAVLAVLEVLAVPGLSALAVVALSALAVLGRLLVRAALVRVWRWWLIWPRGALG